MAVVQAAARVEEWRDMSNSVQGTSRFGSAGENQAPSNNNLALPATTNVQSLSPTDLRGSLRPPTLRARSTGALLLTSTSARESEFDRVEDPSPVLSPTHQGLDGLSASLARLIKRRSHEDDVDQQHHRERDLQQHRALFLPPPDDKNIAFESSKHLENATAQSHNVMLRDSVEDPVNAAVLSEALTKAPAPKGASQTEATSATVAKAQQQRMSPQVADIALKSSAKPSSFLMPAAAIATGSQSQSSTLPSAIGMLRRASADKTASVTPSYAGTPPESGTSTPRLQPGGKGKPQVLETHHLQLQTHGPSGRRMINQYIIETELGRGVHGKVRLARDTETGEKVAVKIVEREGKKRLGGAMGWQQGKSMDQDEGGAASARRERGAKADGGQMFRHVDWTPASDVAATEAGGHARFAALPASPPRSPGPAAVRSGTTPSSSPTSAATAAARYGRWGSGAPSRPTYGDKEAERAREKERERVRKRFLWTTDKKVKREIALLKKCAHENVVQLKEVIDDPSSKKIFMVLEFMEGGEVQWKDDRGFPTLTVDEARRTLRDVVLGLEYLHYQGIIHRDIKPANLLWDGNRKVKISDFGVSHFSYALLVASGGLPSLDSDEERMKDPSLVDDHELAKTAGSPAFFAPELCFAGEPMHTANSQLSPGLPRSGKKDEQLAEFPWKQNQSTSAEDVAGAGSKGSLGRSRGGRPPITKAIDVWALGVTLYCLLFGHVPFTADSE